MSIKTRLRSIEKSRHRPQPWLVLTFLEPSQDQLEQIALAMTTNRFCIVFHPLNASVWLSISDETPWWSEAEENAIIH